MVMMRGKLKENLLVDLKGMHSVRSMGYMRGLWKELLWECVKG